MSSQQADGYDDATAPMNREAIHEYGGMQYAPQGQSQYGYPQSMGPGSGYGRGFGRGGFGRGPRGPIETRPFFVTSEFVGTLLAIIAVAITGAVVNGLEVGLTSILITALVGAYVLSRGIAKAGTRSRSFDPREELLRPEMFGGHGPSSQRQQDPVQHR